jgi:uncharacterized protein (UPF0332 family)
LSAPAPAPLPAEAAAARGALARHLLALAREALDDAALLLGGGRLRGAALRASHAAFAAARALLTPRGLDAPDPAAAALLFGRHFVATDLVSRPCGLAVQHALRTLGEVEASDVPLLYEARVAALREGAALVLAEADIVLDRILAELPAAAPAAPAEEDEE